jgi:hypothetical protein
MKLIWMMIIIAALALAGTASSQEHGLGLIVTPEELADTTSGIALASSMLRISDFTYPVKFDWRKINGTEDWTTEIKDQGSCGSCVQFAMCGTTESLENIEAKNYKLDPDLSEQWLLNHGAGSCSGASFEKALAVMQGTGTTTEACCPYLGSTTCQNPPIHNITGYQVVKTATQAKNWIATKGPLMTGMEVYTDFFNYDGGIYSYEYGDSAGYHAIVVVGYDDSEGYWICKNSWSEAWGESGWFRIKYGECGIGSNFYFYALSVPIPEPGPGPQPEPTNVTWTAKALDRPTGKYQLFMTSPDDKLILTTTPYQEAVLIGNYSKDQNFTFVLQSPKGNFSPSKEIKLINGGSWLYWLGLGEYKWKTDAIIEIRPI